MERRENRLSTNTPINTYFSNFFRCKTNLVALTLNQIGVFGPEGDEREREKKRKFCQMIVYALDV